MTSEFDDLQQLILEDARKFYSETTIDHFMNPRNLGDMEDADGFARVTGSCSDTMEIWLKVKNGTIVTELAKGRSVSEARKISQQDVLGALGGLPEESKHCALLAADTLKEAIRDYLVMEREPWKRAYRKH